MDEIMKRKEKKKYKVEKQYSKHLQLTESSFLILNSIRFWINLRFEEMIFWPLENFEYSKLEIERERDRGGCRLAKIYFYFQNDKQFNQVKDNHIEYVLNVKNTDKTIYMWFSCWKDNDVHIYLLYIHSHTHFHRYINTVHVIVSSPETCITETKMTTFNTI